MQNKNNKNKDQINLVDLFFYLLSHWYWFAICVALALGYTYYKYAKTPFVYRSGVTVVIRDPSNSVRSVRLDAYSNTINNVSMTTEILQLRSKKLMTEAVKLLDADVNYKMKVKFRDVELYRNSPVRMFFSREEDVPDPFAVNIIPLNDKQVKLNLDGLGNYQTVALGDTLTLGGGKVVFQPDTPYGPSWYGQEITVQKLTPENAALGYLSGLQISQDDTILQIVNLAKVKRAIPLVFKVLRCQSTIVINIVLTYKGIVDGTCLCKVKVSVSTVGFCIWFTLK